MAGCTLTMNQFLTHCLSVLFRSQETSSSLDALRPKVLYFRAVAGKH